MARKIRITITREVFEDLPETWDTMSEEGQDEHLNEATDRHMRDSDAMGDADIVDDEEEDGC
jgi:hypothetical protein